jgi:putative ABC transport system permease protein
MLVSSTAAFLPNVFFLGYLRSELLRRKGRTILTLLGLALGVALVIVISSLSRGLDKAQKTALNPLSSIGTDLTVTMQPRGFAGGAFMNRVLETDLSQLGKPGQHFERDVFSAGSQPTFAQSNAKQVAALPGVAKTATGLTLTVTHQEGKIPKITATFQTGGQTYNVHGQVKPPTAAELAQMADCLAKLQKSSSSSGSTTTTTPGNRQAPGQNGGQSGQGQGSGGPELFGGSTAMRKCMPASMRRFQQRFTTPRQTLRQRVNTPQTDIKTSSFAIGGVDTSQTDIGLITPAQVTKGRFLSRSGGREALVAGAYASSHKIKVSSTLSLNKVKFKVVGLVAAPLGGQSADVYIPLGQLQTLAGQKNQINVVLVRAGKSSAVAALQKKIESTFPSASVASSKQVAKQITGSLVDASNLSKSLGLALSAIAIGAAFLLAALLTLSSIAKRVREIGTLRALGWTRRLVIRQIAGEAVVQGVLGGVLGVALGIVAAAVVDAFGPTLTASSTIGNNSDQGPVRSAFGTGRALTRTATSQISLKAPLALSIILIGFALALVGGLLAGATGALRAARLRPADALRQVE